MTYQSKNSSFESLLTKGKIGKTLSKKQAALQKKQEAAKDGGLIQVSFTFDGKKHVQSHRLNQNEMDAQMALLKQHGAQAFEATTLQVTLWGAAQLARHAVEEAFKEYARKNWIAPPEPVSEVTTAEVVEALAKRQGIEMFPSQEPLKLGYEQQAAVDETAGLAPQEAKGE